MSNPPLEFIYYLTQIGTEPKVSITNKIPSGEFVTIRFTKVNKNV